MNFTTFTAVTRKIQSAYGNMCGPLCRKYGLARTSFDILMFLHNNPRYCTARQISQMRNLKPNVVSQHVDRLVRDGYLERQEMEGDRRKIRLLCTGLAEPVCREGSLLQKQFYTGLTENLTRQDLEGVKHCFRVIAENAVRLEKISETEENKC